MRDIQSSRSDIVIHGQDLCPGAKNNLFAFDFRGMSSRKYVCGCLCFVNAAHMASSKIPFFSVQKFDAAFEKHEDRYPRIDSWRSNKSKSNLLLPACFFEKTGEQSWFSITVSFLTVGSTGSNETKWEFSFTGESIYFFDACWHWTIYSEIVALENDCKCFLLLFSRSNHCLEICAFKEHLPFFSFLVETPFHTENQCLEQDFIHEL